MTKEIIIQKVAEATTYGGASSAVYFGLTANEWGIFGGLAIGCAGLIIKSLVSWHFKSKHLALAERALKTGHAQILMESKE